MDGVFQLVVRAINGVHNRSARPLWARNADSEFYQLLDALRRIQRSEALGFRLERRGHEEVSLITFRSDRVTPAVLDDIRLVRTLLRLGNDARELTLAFGAMPRNDRELALLTRSMLNVLLELSAQVDVPAADVEAGKAFPVPPAGPREQTPRPAADQGPVRHRAPDRFFRDRAIRRPLVLDRQPRLPIQDCLHVPAHVDLARRHRRGSAGPGDHDSGELAA